jgi:hypothetical protein
MTPTATPSSAAERPLARGRRPSAMHPAASTVPRTPAAMAGSRSAVSRAVAGWPLVASSRNPASAAVSTTAQLSWRRLMRWCSTRGAR